MKMSVEGTRTPKRAGALVRASQHPECLPREGMYCRLRGHGHAARGLSSEVCRGAADDSGDDAHQWTSSWALAQTVNYAR
jgi:hypothetical protein